ncbi:hypothetical protein JR316_0009230 [Psilocybe cubensis]|uniref:Uncharacterized protein n=1 Tax=Psilocybe cubensis TaxID=181762 RepID=A0ACB8GTI9_PSICU|nr:hypothetical protein JR316_0009230 [Psilocybe cubensis]KAH9478769.1 hypothetical protein JR316_0009230 [Psilocybe cubensis]
MVYSRSKKIGKVSYAELKKTAQANKDKIGPQWSHWVGKAISKLESEGILESASPSGTVALTSNGKQLISRARRSTFPHEKDDINANEEGMIWKQIISGVSKRTRASSVDEYPGSTSATPRKKSSRKRAKISDPASKTSVSKMTKAELKAELDWLREQAQVHYLLRGVSPLTDLDNEEQVENAQLREELKEREEEIEQMRRELSAARAARYRALNDDRENEPDISFSPLIPDATSEVNHVTSPRAPATALSRVYPKGLTRTQSGSCISNISKQPTPAPSSPDDDLPIYDDNMLGLRQSTESTLNQNAVQWPSVVPSGSGNHLGGDRLMDSASPATPLSRVDKRSNEHQGDISTLTTEIESLRKQLEVKTDSLSNRDAEVKALSERIASLDSVLLNQEGSIASLREANARLSAEVADKQDLWKQAKDTVVKTAEQLKAAQSSLEVLRNENTSVADRFVLLELSNEELHRQKDALRDSVDRLKKQELNLKAANERLQNRLNGVMAELTLEKELGDEKLTEIARLNAKHSTDFHVVRQKNEDLEKLVSIYRTEIEEKGLSIESLGNELKQKNLHIEDLSTKLQIMGRSAEDLSARFSGAQSSIASLSQELEDAKRDALSFETRLEATVSELKTELAGRQETVAKLSEKEKEIELERESTNQLRGYVEKLKRDIATKEHGVQQLVGEVEAAREQITSLEGYLADSARTLEAERGQMSTKLSNLESSVTSARIDVARTSESLADANRQLIVLNADLTRKDTKLDTLGATLNEERQEKSRLSADLDTLTRRNNDLQDKLRQYEACKSLDQTTIIDLRNTLAKIRDSQMKLFGEIEEKIISAQPSPSSYQAT